MIQMDIKGFLRILSDFKGFQDISTKFDGFLGNFEENCVVLEFYWFWGIFGILRDSQEL